MADIYDSNFQLDSEFTYQQYAPPAIPLTSITNISGNVTIINTINGRGGSNVTFSGGTTGLDFGGTGSAFILEGTLVVANGGTGATTAAGARANLSAAESGANSDLNTLTALTGAGGWSAWTGTPDKTSHATFSGTASVAYSQAEMQAVMDSLKNVTEGFMALLATLLAWGGTRT